MFSGPMRESPRPASKTTTTFRNTARGLSTAFLNDYWGLYMRSLLLGALCVSTTCWATAPLAVRDIVVPEYPPVARMALLQGSINIDIEIGSNGKVISANAIGGDPILLRAAENNIRLW